MGIVSQLPSYHLPYTECQPSSWTGSCPTGNTDASYSSCLLCLIVTDLHLPAGVLIYSVDAIPLLIPVGLLQTQSLPDSIIYGFLFQNPVQSPMLHSYISATRQSPGFIMLFIFVSYAAVCACAISGRLISFNSFCGSYVVPVFRMV